MATYKAVQLTEAGGDFELVEREVPRPAPGEVLIRVEACGICHSDQFAKEGWWPGIEYPRVPGHEVIGRIEEVGDGVKMWRPGQRVGVGWHGGHCFECAACRRGDFINCANAEVTGITRDGGYAQYMTASQHAAAGVPDELDSYEAAPLLCAGITVYNAMRNSNAKAGDLVAIQGIGGLGHLAVQYGRKMGFRVAALSHGGSKRELAAELGADIYIDTSKVDPSEELRKLGGADMILATAPSPDAVNAVVGGLAREGELMIVAAFQDPVQISPFHLIPGRRSVRGWPSGTAVDSEDTLNFTGHSGIRTRIEKFPLEDAAEAYDHMLANKARFRVVLETK